jgi:hypothetical protein
MTLCVAAPAASAVPTNPTLAELWTKVLQTPSPENSFGTGGQAFACWDLHGTVAPFAPGGVKSCTVKPDTPIFGAWASWECSTFPHDHPGFGTTEAQLRECARAHDVQHAPTVAVDRHAVRVDEVETTLMDIVLPNDPIVGTAGAHGQSVAHGWITLLNPLTLGNHMIVIHSDAFPTIKTTITVKPMP